MQPKRFAGLKGKNARVDDVVAVVVLWKVMRRIDCRFKCDLTLLNPIRGQLKVESIIEIASIPFAVNIYPLSYVRW